MDLPLDNDVIWADQARSGRGQIDVAKVTVTFALITKTFSGN